MQSFTGRSTQDGTPLEVVVDNGAIQSIRRGQVDEDIWISAGFIDLQMNGYGGDDVNAADCTAQTIVSLTRKVVSTGVTTFLPTIITASEERIVASLRAIAEARRCSRLCAEAIPYAHVEGPHISAAFGVRGAHPLEHVRPPSIAEFDRWQQGSDGLVGMITLSPAFDGAEAYIRYVTARGVHVALGHTDATPEQIGRAVDAGAKLSTHLGNGISPTLPRHPNILWTQLAEDRLAATMIADSHHLPADTLKSMVRAKGVKRSILVSDAVALAGTSPGTYDTPVGGRVELHANGRLNMVGTNFLSGAALPLKDGVAWAFSIGVALADAVKMATVNPGRFTGGRGMLRVGARADLLRFRIDEPRHTFDIETIVVAGVEV